MGWMLTFAYFAFMYWCVRKARESAAEYAATGMLRSPLYWTAMILVCVLFGLAFSERYVLTQSSTLIWACWAALGATVIALLHRSPRIEVALSDLAVNAVVVGWVERTGTAFGRSDDKLGETHSLAAAQIDGFRCALPILQDYFASANSVFVS